MSRWEAVTHYLVTVSWSLPIFWLVTHWGRAPSAFWFAVSLSVLWGVVSVWMRAATVLRDQYSVLTPGHRN